MREFTERCQEPGTQLCSHAAICVCQIKTLLVNMTKTRVGPSDALCTFHYFSPDPWHLVLFLNSALLFFTSPFTLGRFYMSA